MICRRCACGCGGIVKKGNRYIHNHHMKGSNNNHWKGGRRSHYLYRTWRRMSKKCYDKNHEKYKYYGGRGIRVCIRWRVSFKAFLHDMGDRSEGMTLERVDNNGNYTPDNCRWATMKEQNKNKRSNIWLTYKGKTLILKDWSKDLGIQYQTLQRRHSKGLRTKDILSLLHMQSKKKILLSDKGI